MKTIIILSLLVVAAVHAEETYSTENDDLDINALVSDLNQLKSFNACFVGTATCSTVAADFKKDIAEAVATACAKCTQAQKHIFKIFLDNLKKKLPQDFEVFKNKYDAEGKHFAALENAVAAF